MKKFQNPWNRIAVQTLPDTSRSQARTTANPMTEGMKTAREYQSGPVPWYVPKKIRGKCHTV